MKLGKRKLADGRDVDVGRNFGVRKVCACPRRRQAKCPHPWHFNFAWKGRAYRFSLDRHVGRHVESRSDAEALADQLRTAIRSGEFGASRADVGVPGPGPDILTFREFAELWAQRRGYQLARPRDNDYRLKLINAFGIPGSDPPVTFGDKPAVSITTGDIEAYRHHRRSSGLSAVTSNHDLKLLRKMFAWGVRERLIPATPFKVSTETVIRLDPETPRERRFRSEKDEARLLKAADPQLRAVIVAMLDTCCRPGELLSLQWRDVDLEHREITIRSEKTKTRRGRVLPISSRLLAILQMRRHDPAGCPFPPDAYVFGDELGRQVTSVRAAWEDARAKAGLPDFHLADLRHEAASRFEEAGVPTTYVSKFLGHRNLTTTTRYLNATLRGLRLAVEKLEESRRQARRAAKSRRPAGEKAAPLANGLQTRPGRGSRPPASADESSSRKPLIS
jgi:integrase